jgi:hypothetical protein
MWPRKFCLLSSVLCLLTLTGCGAEMTAGGMGLGVGAGLSNTFAGMQADLEKQEQELIDRYNKLHAAGATAEDLADVERQLEQTVQLRQGAQTTERFLGTDWSNPQESATRIGEGLGLLWLIFNRRKLGQKYVAMKAGQAQLKIADPAAYEKSYALVGTERAKLGL